MQPYLKGMPCSVAQLRLVARQLSDDDAADVYYCELEDRVILN